MNQFKAFILLPLILGMMACSGGGTNSAPVNRNADAGSGTTPEDGGTLPEEGETPTEPQTVLLDGNLYFPLADGVIWHYSNGDQVTFESGRTVQGRDLIAMKHSSSAMPSEEYIQRSDSKVFYGGLYVPVSIPSLGDFEARVEFKTLRTLYDHVADKGENVFVSSKADIVEGTSGVSQEVDYDWVSAVVSKSMVDAGQFGSVPAVELQVNIDYVIVIPNVTVLQRYPLLTTTLWLSPGLGIVARKFGDTVIALDRVDGIQKPVVFEFDQGNGLSQSPQQLLVDGTVVTDMGVTMVVAYGTEATNWLNLEFDGSGSWRVSITGDELAAGIHGAVVQMTRDGNRVDIPVSVLVH